MGATPQPVSPSLQTLILGQSLWEPPSGSQSRDPEKTLGMQKPATNHPANLKIPFPTSLHTPTPGLTQWLGGAEELASSVEMEIWAFSSRPKDTGIFIWRHWAAFGAPRGQEDRLKTETTPDHKGKFLDGGGRDLQVGGRRKVPFGSSVVGSHQGKEFGETDSCASGRSDGQTSLR